MKKNYNMELKQLGKTNYKITPVGFGAWAIGGAGWVFGWGKQDDEDSKKAIYKAIDLGINWIDTAAVYGLGHAEEVIGKALVGMKVKPYVFTKCELVWDENRNVYGSLKKDSIKRECEASLRRLKIEAIDLYQIHWPDPDTDIEEGWEAINELMSEGKVRYAGVSNFNVQQMKRCETLGHIYTLQPPYSMLRRAIEKETLPYCRQNETGVIIYSPMQSGLLTGKMTKERMASMADDDWRRSNKEFTEPRLSKNLELVEKLKSIGNQYGVTAGVVAIAWTLYNSGVTAAIAGARNESQVMEISKALDFRLSPEEYKQIEVWLEENK